MVESRLSQAGSERIANSNRTRSKIRRKCQPGCSCKRHKNVGSKCPSGCQCVKHSWSEERRKRHSIALTGRKIPPYTQERNEKISATLRQGWADGRISNPPGRYKGSGGYHRGVWMRCLNSEGVFAEELDKCGIAWLYEPKRFKTSVGVYIPDFYLPEFDIWIEVKGYPPLPKSLAKMSAFRQEYSKCLVVVYQHELPAIKYGKDVGDG